MTNPDLFTPYTSYVLGGMLMHSHPVTMPVEIELEDANGNRLGHATRLWVVQLEDAEGEPTKVVIIGRLPDMVELDAQTTK